MTARNNIMRKPSSVPMKIWADEPPPAEVAQALRRLSQADDVCRLAVMPDVHLAKEVCNGVVVATHELIYPQAVGGDIGCGMLAAAFDGDVTPFENSDDAERVLAEFARRIPSNRHSPETQPELPDELAETALSDDRLQRESQRDGRVQLGTLGRGNHFVELQADGDERLWIMIHSGSRAMGQEITAHHLRRAERHGPGGLLALDSRSDDGAAYLRDMAWAVRYAEENRLAMLRAAGSVLADALGYRLDESTLISAHHNHVRCETHFGEPLWVHRKGAMPADESLAGVIPGSMGTCSFHVTGRGCDAALRSCSHGAGRTLPRHVAQRTVGRDDLFRQMHNVWFDESLSGALCEEAPAAYKDVRSVMRAQRELVRITRELRPVLVYKGT
jgi:tRNA-splicing ligase RtcB